MSHRISVPRKKYMDAIQKLESCLYKDCINRDCIDRGSIREVLYDFINIEYIICNCQSVSPSFFKTVREVEKQIGADAFKGPYGKDIPDLCKIIAEIYITPTGAEDGSPRMMKINGLPVCVSTVKEIYQKLTQAHIELVMENFHSTTAKIHNKRAYLQTALFNSVLEMNLHYTNQVKHDLYN